MRNPKMMGQFKGTFHRYQLRNDDIIKMYREGRTLQECGDRFGLTRERVRQLLNKHNIPTRKYTRRDIPQNQILVQEIADRVDLFLPELSKVFRENRIPTRRVGLRLTVYRRQLPTIENLFPGLERGKCKHCGKPINYGFRRKKHLGFCTYCYRNGYKVIPELTKRQMESTDRWYRKMKKDPVRWAAHLKYQSEYQKRYQKKLREARRLQCA